MEQIQLQSVPEISLDAERTFFQRKYDDLRRSIGRRRAYRITRHALSVQSDRSLKDLGIPRCSIRNLALEASHDV